MKILAVASVGGHWTELLRLLPAFEGNEIIFASTKQSVAETLEFSKFHVIPDINRNDKRKLPNALYKIFALVSSIRPDIIISTGALPGLLSIIAGKIYGAKTIWVDSIANVKELSLSGKIASRVADRTYTQWPDLTNKRCLFHGNVLS
ncbi:UDP-N-acetylglucosamine transferase subunit ALG14 [Gramella sp. AN32]|uniref:Oligosaccharide biosynthesis protein Alg14 n=1 Tax=Christiangramia antarctica TaxID=2058158 RepID=A0ABW5X4J9_9FLAO|nr:UDP-N-acetylglucosamine transferase subunit ALG14 [Gramella sp. AN32]MCM4156129.1 oligosaccharide biosynthesis protein Alg14 [Gramella sp. AN32]